MLVLVVQVPSRGRCSCPAIVILARDRTLCTLDWHGFEVVVFVAGEATCPDIHVMHVQVVR